MHTRTYADPEIVKYRDKFVWVVVDPNQSSAHQALVDEYYEKLEAEFSTYLSFPTAIVMTNDLKILKIAIGRNSPKEIKAILDEALELAGKK